VTKRNNLLAVFLLLLLPSISYADTNGADLKVLATAKIAGACGILDSMISFQKTTKMPGGDEFVSRFWSVEAARLGISVQELAQRCDKAVVMYDHMWALMDAKTK
jgi:predicted outer membrane protein